MFLMLIWLCWQDEQTVKDKIPEASMDVSIFLLV
jgi:hypothetical protein